MTKGNLTIGPDSIALIRDSLQDNPRNLLLFELGTGSGMRMSQILNLKLKDTYQSEIFKDNHFIKKALGLYLSSAELEAEDYLFTSKKGNKPLSLSTVSNLVKSWLENVGISEAVGYSSLYDIYQQHSKDGYEDTSALSFDIPDIQHETVQKQIYNVLYDGIIMGTIAPGTELISGELAKQFGTSLTPVRYALASLEAQNLVISSPKKSSIVAEVSYEAAIESYIIRKVLEPMAFEKAWRNFSHTTYTELANTINSYSADGDWETFIKLHTKFHTTLHRDSNMPILIDIIYDLLKKTNSVLYRYYAGLEPEEVKLKKQISIEKHRKILGYIEQNNPEGVLSQLWLDLVDGQNDINQYFEKRKSADSI